jgi:hypothetical protein
LPQGGDIPGAHFLTVRHGWLVGGQQLLHL